MDYILIVCTVFCVIVAILSIIVWLKRRKTPVVGVLKIDTSDDEKDKYMLEVDKIPLDDLEKFTEVIFKVQAQK